MTDMNTPPSLGPAEHNDDKTYVVLPCEPQHFKSFVAGLLGKPQEHKGSVEGVFRVAPKDIANIYHLISQRVQKQNHGTLIHFSLTVHYSDGISITHNSVEAFECYHPTTKCHSVAITIFLSYLITFSGRQYPEKQEIEISLSTDPDHYLGEGKYQHWFQSGLLSYRIIHTEVTWATDIAGLLKNHAESIIEKSSGLKLFLAANSDELMTYWFTIIFVGTMVFWGKSGVGIYESNSITTIPAATRYLTLSLSIFLSTGAILYSIRSFYDRHIFLRTPSFILLTQSDIDHSIKLERKLLGRWLGHFAGWLLGLASGVLSNHLYTLLAK